MIEKKIKIERLSSIHFERVFNYYSLNKKHLEPWEPTRKNGYYSLDFHIKRTKERLDLMKINKSMHFILLNNIKYQFILCRT